MKPFLKWAGGKTQLLPVLSEIIPTGDTYIEPFIGAGSVMLNSAHKYKNIVINDVNTDLVKTYETIKKHPLKLISILSSYQYLFDKEENKKQFFLQMREKFNDRTYDDITQACLMIFLNKTCFNGLYRVNKSNNFNVSWNKMTNTTLFDKQNILDVSEVLQKATILNDDYSETLKYVEGETFFYLDPPYKPISKTSAFNSYDKSGFNDDDQTNLSEFCKSLDSKWLMSNSNCELFYELYSEFNIKEVDASRQINSNGDKRGKIKELLIYNF